MARRAPHIVQVQLGECMKNIVLVDFPEKWPSLLPQLTQNLQSQVPPSGPLDSLHFAFCTLNFFLIMPNHSTALKQFLCMFESNQGGFSSLSGPQC